MSSKYLPSTFAVTLILVVGTLGKVAAQPSDDPGGQAAAVGRDDSRQEKPPLHVLKLPRSNLGPVPPELIRPIGVAPKNRPIVEKLQSRRLSLDVREVPLADIVASVRDQVGVNVLLDRSALEEEGINTDTPLTVRLMDVPLGQGLALLLEPYNLTYIVTHGVILITSQLEAGNELTFQIYPVADLVWAQDAAGKGVFDFDRLIKLIEELIAPNSWSVVGGPGSIRSVSGSLSLAINQTQAVHDQITDVLDTLRQARGMMDAAQTPRVKNLPKPDIEPTVIGIGRREDELLRRTRESMISLSFVEVPFSDVVDFLRDKSNLPFVLDRQAMEEEGIAVDTPVTIHVYHVGLDDALFLLLRQYNLTWHVNNDVIQITSQNQAAGELRTLCYPVGDLVLLSDGKDRWSIFQCELQDLIQEAVSPNAWSCVGGNGTIQYFPGSQCLMVSQSSGVHERIPELLAWLRESNDRLPAITRAAGMPSPDKLAESRLRDARAADDRVQDAKRLADERTAESARRAAEESQDPDLARRRAELELIKAQIRQAEAAAAKTEAELAQLKAKWLRATREGTKPPEPEACPHCGNPLGK